MRPTKKPGLKKGGFANLHGARAPPAQARKINAHAPRNATSAPARSQARPVETTGLLVSPGIGSTFVVVPEKIGFSMGCCTNSIRHDNRQGRLALPGQRSPTTQQAPEVCP